MVFSIIFNSSSSYYFLDILTSSKINMSKSREKIYILTGLSLLCLTSVIAFGAEPPVQMATLRWSGDGEFMSWRWEKLGEAFEDGAARFAAESRIVSPTWASFAGAKEIDDGADGWEGVALGWGQTNVKRGFKLIAKLDQVEGVTSEVGEKGVVEAHLRRRNAEVPRDKGLHLVLQHVAHLPRIIPRAC